MIRKVKSIIFIMLILCMFTGCAKIADEKKIQEELESGEYSQLLSDGEAIDKIEIIDRSTDKKEKTDIVECNVTTEDDEIKYLKRVTLNYSLQKKGWILEYVNVAPEYEWGKKPLKGVDEEKIEKLLIDQSVIIDGEEWVITADMIKNVSIDSEDTDLENNADTVVFDLTLSSQVEDAEGQITATFVFFDAWSVASMEVSKPFVAAINPEYAPDYTDEDFIAEIVKQEFELVDNNENQMFVMISSANQTVTMSKEEITDFKIEDQQSSEKGTVQTYNCSCILNKPYVSFLLQSAITCFYDSSTGWNIQSIETTHQLQELDLSGEWTGTYTRIGNNEGKVVLNITQIDNSGKIEAIYSYEPNEISRFVQPGSFSLSGEINKNTLEINLDAGEWIEEPSEHLSVDKCNIVALLDLDEAVIRGSGHGSCSFEVKK